MEDHLNCSGSIKELRLLSLTNIKDGHSTSRMLEEHPICKCGTLILDGGKSSDIKERTLLILRTRRFLMFQETKISKVTMFKFGEDIMDLTKDGRLFISIKRELAKRQVLIVTSASMFQDHSTLDQDYQ